MSLWADLSAAEAWTPTVHASPAHTLTADQAAALLRLLDGVYAPLDGFMAAPAAADVASARRLADGTYWPVPVVLDVPPATAERMAMGGALVLREAEGRAVAVIPEAVAWQDAAGWRVGGRVVGLQAPPAYDHVDLRLSPAELAEERGRRGWTDAIAVFLDRVPGRTEIEALARLAQPGTGLVIFAVVAAGAVADRDLYARVQALRLAVAHLPRGAAVAVLDGRPSAEGAPGGAADALVARAYGCRRLVAWGDPAPALVDAAGALDVALTIVPAGPPRPRPATRDALAAWTYPDIAAELVRRTPAGPGGVAIFFTGLSGSGKSTIANALRVRLLEDGRRTVTLLDGDLVRTHLSSELGFSREHRTLNVRRIAFVAAEITRHGGLAICAPIAPYASLRREARALVEAAGTFLLIHVSTPIAVCEARDVKGLYKRARAGTLPEFTGVSDPYDEPEDAEITIDTSEVTVPQAVDRLMAALEARGLLTPTSG